MDEWKNVRDSLPEEGQFGCSETVLFIISDDISNDEIESNFAIGWYDYCYERWYYFDPANYEGRAVDEFSAVTYWMNLPDIPGGISAWDCTELSEWHIKGEKEADNPGAFLTRPEKIKMGGIAKGINVNDIVKELPPEVGKAFREIADILETQPDRVKRCEKYADALDEYNKTFCDIPAEIAPIFRNDDWRSGKYNYVFLKGYSKNALSELMDIGIEWEKENGDCGTSRIFIGHCHIEQENGDYIDALEINDFITITKDDKVFLKEWENDNGRRQESI